jgi:hypothetical protein
MTKNPKNAQRVLVSIATRLALATVPSMTEDMLVEDLAEILPDCFVCSDNVLPIRSAAERLVYAKDARSRSQAEMGLRQAVVRFHTLTAAQLIHEWKGEGGHNEFSP